MSVPQAVDFPYVSTSNNNKRSCSYPLTRIPILALNSLSSTVVTEIPVNMHNDNLITTAINTASMHASPLYLQG